MIGNLHLACKGYDRDAEKGISREWNDDVQMKWKHSWLAKENVTEEIFQVAVEALSLCQRQKIRGLTRMIAGTNVSDGPLKELNRLNICNYVDWDPNTNAMIVCAKVLETGQEVLCEEHEEITSQYASKGTLC